ncbi:DNA sulfur modification protein DndE [Rhizobium sp. L1K21]|uniref:DNA sulfur modification protein DndE n=1 Tax=Rhizobium sp. L1K21 TaxID=2954933 RepID=UPI002093871B|nr:DNA sulfur modification protein DndE [Rhizobium sp. L1K21]MCO6185211.1 DNA sulfur modification protein DndE [Rhizobium sp. L1K21]
MHISKFRVSDEATGRLRVLRQRAALTPNLLCRMAMAISLEMGKIGSATDTEDGQEFNAYTLFGADQPIYTTLLRWVETEDGEELDERELIRRLRAHIDRGLTAISARVKSPGDAARLLAGDILVR